MRGLYRNKNEDKIIGKIDKGGANNTSIDQSNNRRKLPENLSFLSQVNNAKNDPKFEDAISNPESNAFKIAKNIIEGKKLIEVYGLTEENFKNYVRDSGENVLVLAAICFKLAEDRAGLNEAKREETEE
jgi:hypothetical protein